MRSEGYSTWSVSSSVRPSVRPSVCYHVFCHYAQQSGQKVKPTGSVPHWLYFKNGDFRKSTAFKSYGVKTKRSSQYANEHGLPRPDFLPVSSTVEAVDVTRRVSMWSWFAKNSTYRRSYIARVFTVFEKVAAYLYIPHAYCSCTRMYYKYTCNVYTHKLIYACVMLPTGVEENTHTNNAGYSNGSSLPVEGLEIIDV